MRLIIVLLAAASAAAVRLSPLRSAGQQPAPTLHTHRHGAAKLQQLRAGGSGSGGGKPVVLVTGGVGYIGSHTVLELLQSGYDVVVADNLCNSNLECLRRVEKLAGRSAAFHHVDMRDKEALAALFEQYEVGSVIHFAGLKAVGESVAQPLTYYQVNVQGTLNLVEVMAAAGVHNIVFSSSATVYGDPASVPVTESFPTGPTNPYGHSKLMNEQILSDVAASDGRWNVCLLRYFNPVGAHPSGRIGEDPKGIPNNLVPFIQQVAVGKRPHLSVFGSDYPTHDGTGVRDYIHVVDLAKGHLAALRKLEAEPGCVTYNLGTGTGYSVLDIVKAYSEACGHELAYKLAERRPGDVALVYADPSFAAAELGWKAELGIARMCADSWRWIEKHPDGFDTQ
jgi:UDP-glucose 4-epimerase